MYYSKRYYFYVDFKEGHNKMPTVFPSGHPSKYKLRPTLLNFSDWMRTGAFNVVWSLANISSCQSANNNSTMHAYL